MYIVDFFYEMARTNLQIKTFRYGKPKAKGAGSDIYPLIWLDDPVSGSNARSESPAVLGWVANVDILGVPDGEDDVVNVQKAAFLTGLSIIERSQKINQDTGVTVNGFSFISLRDYYDDRAAGYRFTYQLSQANFIDRCADPYDPNKVFTPLAPLPSFDTVAAEGCAVFNDHTGLPNFSTAPDE